MELAVFLPTICLAVFFALSILLYSVKKVYGPGILSFRRKAQVAADGEERSSPGGELHPSRGHTIQPLLVPGLGETAVCLPGCCAPYIARCTYFLEFAGDVESQGNDVPAPTPHLEAHLSLGFSVASYSWSGLTLTVRDKMTGKLKQLLRSCAGTALVGDLIALMGPSGKSGRPFETLQPPIA
jgi:hypothetical protein